MVHEVLQVFQRLTADGDTAAVQFFGVLLVGQPHEVARNVLVMGAEDVGKLMLVQCFHIAVADFLAQNAADYCYHDGHLGDLQFRGVVATKDAAELVVLVAAVAVAEVFSAAQRDMDVLVQKAPFAKAVVQI